MPAESFVLAIASHKGGTGRTTASCALAWLWGQSGLRVALADVDPVQAVRLIALDSSGECPWENVRYFDGLPEPDSGADLVIVDTPQLLDPLVQPALQRCHAVVLTCLADPLSLRTVPAAAQVLATARVTNPRLELLGVLIGMYNSLDVIQAPMLGRLRQMHGDLLLTPPVPYDPLIRDWAAAPGSPLPVCRAADAYASVGDQISDLVLRQFGIDLTGVRAEGVAR